MCSEIPLVCYFIWEYIELGSGKGVPVGGNRRNILRHRFSDVYQNEEPLPTGNNIVGFTIRLSHEQLNVTVMGEAEPFLSFDFTWHTDITHVAFM